MPRKRKNNNLLKKQKMVIASRLMQISLKVDDYIYKDVPITNRSAEMFIKEVSGYRNKCSDDPRSLQVIEKLIRCMKGIIEEQKESKLGSSVERHEFTYANEVNTLPVFPTYSTEYEDLQYTQEIDIDNILKPHKDKILQGPNAGANNENTECEDSLHLQRAISGLSIREEDPLPVPVFDSADCSQSILNNFDCFGNIDEDLTMATDKLVYREDFEEVIQSVTITKECNSSKTDANKTGIVENVPKTHNKDSINQIDQSNKTNTDKYKSTHLIKPPNKLSNDKTIKNNTIEKPQRKRGQKSTENFKNTVKQPYTKKKRTHAIKSSTNICKKIKKVDKTGVHNPIVGNISIPDKDDLSWIENLKYVREIAPDESISTLIEESFWENYCLPNNWNNEDFLYN